MNHLRLFACAAALAGAAALHGQELVASNTAAEGAASTRRAAQPAPAATEGPFSRLAWSEGVSSLGGNVSVVTNLGQQVNLRIAGNALIYSVNNIQTNGITLGAKANFASAQVALDIYPWQRHGFHLTPGVLAYNGNHISASANVPAGESLTLNGTTYYSAYTNPVTGATPLTGSGKVVLNRYNPTPTLTAGWGNLMKHTGHFTFPVEIGAAFIGHPTIGLNLAGWACLDQAQTLCTNLADPTNPIAVQVHQNLNTQMESWKQKLTPLSAYPIVSFGIGYSFGTRGL
jgi:hypothetical protein